MKIYDHLYHCNQWLLFQQLNFVAIFSILCSVLSARFLTTMYGHNHDPEITLSLS